MVGIGARLGAMIRSELSAFIVAKATRRKDVKSVAKTKTATTTPGNEPTNSTVLGDLTGKPINEDNEDAQKSRQAQINLVGVDTKRVADFSTFWFLYPATVVRLTVSVWILVTLIGWAALLAGLGVFVLILPVNVYASRAYTKTQGDLMTLRDQKMV